MKRQASELIFTLARRMPDKLAIVRPNGIGASYSQLIRIYDTVATFLQSIAITSATRIALISIDDFSQALLALPVLENATLVQAKLGLSPDQYQDYFQLTRVAYLLTDGSVPVAAQAATAAGLGLISYHLEYAGDQLAFHLEVIRDPQAGLPAPDLTREISHVVTTSGTTGTPKVVPVRYASLDLYAQHEVEHYQLGPDDLTLITSRMGRSNTLSSIFRVLYAGATCYLLNGFDYVQFLELVSSLPVTFLIMPPAVLYTITSQLTSQNKTRIPNQLRLVLSTGAALDERVKSDFEKIFGVTVHERYGMTETQNIANTYRAPAGFRKGSTGYPFYHQVKIQDGEILVSGATVFTGYENDPEETRNRLVDGWFKTGDLGYLDEDGYIYITGRVKELINRGGEKISPYKVESAVKTLSGIAHAAAFPYPNAFGSDLVGLAVTVNPGQTYTLDEIRTALTGLLTPYEMPAQVYLLPDIPMGSHGKIQRNNLHRQIQDQYPGIAPIGEQSRDTRSGHRQTAATPTEKKLVRIWKKVLQKKQIGLDDPFHVLGGDSLGMALLANDIETVLSVRLEMAALAEATTIRKQAQLIESVRSTALSYRFVRPLKLERQGRTFFFVHQSTGHVINYLTLAQVLPGFSVYGIQFNKKDRSWQHPLTFTQMAAQYLKEIIQIDPVGPYLLGGFCYGGRLAYEIARLLHEQGRTVDLVALFDALLPDPKSKMTRRVKAPPKKRAWIADFRAKPLTHYPGLFLHKSRKTITRGLDRLRSRLPYRLIATLPIGKSLYLSLLPDVTILKYGSRQHREQACPCKVVYFQPIDSADRSAGSIQTWQSLVSEFIVVPIEGRHGYRHYLRSTDQIARVIRDLVRPADHERQAET